jgi:hypothetical protein
MVRGVVVLVWDKWSVSLLKELQSMLTSESVGFFTVFKGRHDG